MPEATPDPLYTQVSQLLSAAGAEVGEAGSTIHAKAADPAAVMHSFRGQLDAAGLREENAPVFRDGEARLTIVNRIDRQVSVHIDR